MDVGKFYKLSVVIKDKQLTFRGKFLKEDKDFIFLNDIREGVIGLSKATVVFINEEVEQ